MTYPHYLLVKLEESLAHTQIATQDAKQTCDLQKLGVSFGGLLAIMDELIDRGLDPSSIRWNRQQIRPYLRARYLC